jgi:hypothetical protein
MSAVIAGFSKCARRANRRTCVFVDRANFSALRAHYFFPANFILMSLRISGNCAQERRL